MNKHIILKTGVMLLASASLSMTSSCGLFGSTPIAGSAPITGSSPASGIIGSKPPAGVSAKIFSLLGGHFGPGSSQSGEEGSVPYRYPSKG